MPLRRCACTLALLLVTNAALSARAGEPFPFGSELMLDTAPAAGSKRLPMIQIEDDGSAAIDLWCGSVKAQAAVGDDGTRADTRRARQRAMLGRPRGRR